MLERIGGLANIPADLINIRQGKTNPTSTGLSYREKIRVTYDAISQENTLYSMPRYVKAPRYPPP